MSRGIQRTNVDKLGDYLLSWTALGQFFLAVVQTFLIDSGLFLEETAGMFRVMGSAVLVVVSLRWVLGRKAVLSLVTYMLLMILFLFSIAMNSDNMEYVMSDGIRITACTVIPVFLSLASIRDMKVFHLAALHISLVTSFVGIFYMFFSLTGRLPGKLLYNMNFGYSLLFPALYLFFCRRPILTFFAILLSLTIFIEGSRGPLLPIGIFIVLQHLLFGSIGRRFFFIFLILLGLSLFMSFLPVVIDWFDSVGLHSRTLALLVSGEMTENTGREAIYELAVSKMWERPFLGYGVFGDRVFLDSTYCHNIFLELAIDFGVFVSTLLILSLLGLLLWILPKLSRENLVFLLLLALASIFPLCLSSSYLIDFRLFLFLGYVYKLYRKYSYKNRQHTVQDFSSNCVELYS